MSVRIVAQIALAEQVPDADVEALVAALGGCADEVEEIHRSHAARNAVGSVGGGDLTLDLHFTSDAACASLLERSAALPGVGLAAALGQGVAPHLPSVAQTDAVVVEPLASKVGRPGLAGVKRTLLLRVYPDAPTEHVAQFERDMLAMPDHVPAIRNWSFGRVRTGAPNPGPSRWTHHWEQEFETLAGLSVDYMMTPYHWGLIDGWFNPEHPEAVVDVWLAHVFCPATDSVLSWS